MSHQTEDIVGLASGFVGYILHSFGFDLIDLHSAIPQLAEIIHSVIMAAVCGVTGFVVTRFCNYFYYKLRKR